jgi:hypothetical protein
VVVLAGSCKTGNGSRDKKMNKDILEVEQHATVSSSLLQATRISRSPESSRCWARLTKSPSPCWYILRATAQRPRLILWCLTSSGDSRTRAF